MTENCRLGLTHCRCQRRCEPPVEQSDSAASVDAHVCIQASPATVTTAKLKRQQDWQPDVGIPSCLCTLHIFHVVQAELHHLVPSAPDCTQAQAAPQAWRLYQPYSLCMQYCALDCHVSYIPGARLCKSCAAASACTAECHAVRQGCVKAVLHPKHAKLYVILSGRLV